MLIYLLCCVILQSKLALTQVLRDVAGSDDNPVLQFKRAENGHLYLQLLLGTPPQTISSIISLDSPITMLPCRKSSSQEPNHETATPGFLIQASNKSTIQRCGTGPDDCSSTICDPYQQICLVKERDGMISGYYRHDAIWFGSVGKPSSYPFKFGCYRDIEHGLARVGLGPGSEFVSTIRKHFKIGGSETSAPLFSLSIFSNQSTLNLSPSTSRRDGDITIGLINGRYGLILQKLTPGNMVESKAMNIDSFITLESADSYLPAIVYNNLITNIATFCKDGAHCEGYKPGMPGQNFSQCFSSMNPEISWASFPSIRVQFADNLEQIWGPASLFIKNASLYCLGFRSHNETYALLGENFLQNRTLVFYPNLTHQPIPTKTQTQQPEQLPIFEPTPVNVKEPPKSPTEPTSTLSMIILISAVVLIALLLGIWYAVRRWKNRRQYIYQRVGEKSIELDAISRLPL